jgi:diguanylate cyclase (GGDEF)-like protein
MDNFKKVNDVHGHHRGDEAIIFLRDMLLEHSRPGDVIARLGGDEFAMWLDGIHADVAEERAKDLIESSKALQKFSGDDDHPLGLSVGVALYDPATNEHIDQLVARADTAMYEIKNKGKGGYIMANPLIVGDAPSSQKSQVGAKTP